MPHHGRVVLLFLHRAFFAQAMTESHADPSKSPYSQSVIAAYQSACVIVDGTREQFMKKPLLCGRVWRIWSFAFSAAVSTALILR